MSKSGKRFRKPSRLGIERLENRCLLAADFAAGALPDVGICEPVQCEIASAEYPAETIEAVECDLGDVAMDPAQSVEAVTTEIASDATTTPDPRNLDLSDGMDGYFGSINAEQPTESLRFTAAEDGVVDIVVASSFGDGDMVLSVEDGSGQVIEMTSRSMEGFDSLSFEASEGETYEVTISSTQDDCEGRFQLTVGFEKFVDQHTDEVGDASTELDLSNGNASLEGKLESAGDVDTFRFTSPVSGEATLELREMVSDDRIDLDISVLDSEGNVIVEGATNQFLQLTLDVAEGEAYFISLTAGEGQKGDYAFEMKFEAAEVAVSEGEVADEEDAGGDLDAEVDEATDLVDSEPGDEGAGEAIDESDAVDSDVDSGIDAEIAPIDDVESDPEDQLVSEVECEDPETEVAEEESEEPALVDDSELTDDSELLVGETIETPVESALDDENAETNPDSTIEGVEDEAVVGDGTEEQEGELADESVVAEELPAIVEVEEGAIEEGVVDEGAVECPPESSELEVDLVDADNVVVVDDALIGDATIGDGSIETELPVDSELVFEIENELEDQLSGDILPVDCELDLDEKEETSVDLEVELEDELASVDETETVVEDEVDLSEEVVCTFDGDSLDDFFQSIGESDPFDFHQSGFLSLFGRGGLFWG